MGPIATMRRCVVPARLFSKVGWLADAIATQLSNGFGQAAAIGQWQPRHSSEAPGSSDRRANIKRRDTMRRYHRLYIRRQQPD